MFELLEKFVKEGNPIKIFINNANLRIVKSCEKPSSRSVRVLGVSTCLSKAFLKADRSVVDKSGYDLIPHPRSIKIENGLDKLLLKGPLFIVFRYDKFQLRSNLIQDRNVICEYDSIYDILINKNCLEYV